MSSRLHVFPFENERLLFLFALCMTTFPCFVTIFVSAVVSRSHQNI